jgi:hypothetical protein
MGLFPHSLRPLEPLPNFGIRRSPTRQNGGGPRLAFRTITCILGLDLGPFSFHVVAMFLNVPKRALDLLD